MSQINDCILAALELNGYGNQWNDGMLAWAKANGATADQLNDAILEALQASGATAEQLNDAWFEVLRGQGYTGALNDMLWQFWCVDGGSLGLLSIFAARLVSSLIPETAVDPAYTFTRAGTTATVTDFEGLVKNTAANEARFAGARRVENLCIASEDFTNSAWIKIFATADAADQLTATASDAVSIYPISIVSTALYVFSVEIRRVSGTGDIAISTDNNSWVVVPVTGTYQRFSVLQVPGGGAPGIRISVNGDSINARNAQFELVEVSSNQNPGDYVATGVSANHGSNVDTVKYFNYENGNTVVGNVVTEAQGPAISAATLKGVLIEEARTNNCLYSADLSNAAWVASNITKSSDGIQLPDGTTGTAETLTASAGNNGTLLQTITLAAAANTFSVYLQRKTGTGNIDITLDNGATWTTKTLTGVGTWDRVDIQGGSAANPIVGIRIVTSGDAVQMWGAQLETGAFATSYIPTVGAAATRNAESLSYSNTNFSDVEGSLAMTFTPSADTAQYVGGGARELLGVRASVGDVLSLASSSGKLSLNDGTTETNSATMPALVAGTALKLAGRWSALGSVYQLRQDDTNSNAAVFDGSMNKSAVMSVGYSGSRPNGTYKDVKTYDGYLSDEAFEALTV